jgi:FdhE protein
MTRTAPRDADPLVVRLRKIAHESPDLRQAAQLYEVILPLLRDAEIPVAAVSLTKEALSGLQEGVPLLSSIAFEVDLDAARALTVRIASAIESFNKTLSCAAAAASIRKALETGALDIGILLSCITSGNRAALSAQAGEHQLEPGLLWTLGQNTLRPALKALCRALSPLAGGVPWNRGYCFICGAVATFGELRKDAQVKHLRCGQCGADWQFPRLRCMHCGNEDHRTLGCVYEEERRAKWRIEVCEDCRGYVKVIASFDPVPAEMVPVEDLATLHLDHVAADRGYKRIDLL